MNKVQLANPYNPTKNYRVAHWFATPKFDGVRAVFIPDRGFFTRNDKPISGLDHMAGILQEFCTVRGLSFVDGELVLARGDEYCARMKGFSMEEKFRSTYLTLYERNKARRVLRLRMDVANEPKDEDATPEESPSVVSREGDLWILGDHRLICGSSTDPETVSRLLAGARPHLMVTDPPYGVNYDPAWRSQIHDSPALRTGRVLNDDLADWHEAWALFPGDVAYIWHASLHGETVAKSLRVCGFGVRAQIIWAKPRFALSRGDYHWQHECCMYALKDTICPDLPGYCPGYESCWYAIREGEKSHWQGSRSESTLWEIDYKDQDAQTTHGTQKPVECMRRPMLNNSEPNDIIYEPFSGSGTTILGEVVESYWRNQFDSEGLKAAQTRLVTAQAELKEAELAENRGELHRASAIAKVWTDQVLNAKTHLLAIPTKVGPMLVGQELQVIVKKLKDAIYEALKELADYDSEKITRTAAILRNQ